jgi:hypothetical protein
MGSGRPPGAIGVVGFEIGEKKIFGSENFSKCWKNIFLPKVRQKTDHFSLSDTCKNFESENFFCPNLAGNVIYGVGVCPGCLPSG